MPIFYNAQRYRNGVRLVSLAPDLTGRSEFFPQPPTMSDIAFGKKLQLAVSRALNAGHQIQQTTIDRNFTG